MTLSVIQQLVLEALADGKQRTSHEIKRAGKILNTVAPQTMRSLVRRSLVAEHDALDPTTYTITQEGLSALEARSNTKGE